MRRHCSAFEKILIRGIPKDWGLFKTVYGDSNVVMVFAQANGAKVTVLISCDAPLTNNKPKKRLFDQICLAFKRFFETIRTFGRK